MAHWQAGKISKMADDISFDFDIGPGGSPDDFRVSSMNWLLTELKACVQCSAMSTVDLQTCNLFIHRLRPVLEI